MTTQHAEQGVKNSVFYACFGIHTIPNAISYALCIACMYNDTPMNKPTHYGDVWNVYSKDFCNKWMLFSYEWYSRNRGIHQWINTPIMKKIHEYSKDFWNKWKVFSFEWYSRNRGINQRINPPIMKKIYEYSKDFLKQVKGIQLWMIFAK